MLPAARIGDPYVCLVPFFLPGVISGPGSTKVLIGGQPAALLGTTCLCLGFIPDPIVSGSTKVLIEGRPAAKLGDSTAFLGLLIFPYPKVLIG